jgi:RNA recognition motif-containing protein
LFIGLLNATSEADFYNYFAKFGKIDDYFLQRDQATGESKGYGFLVYED